MHEQILILDTGSRFTQLIARRVRAAGVYCQVHPASRASELLQSGQAECLKGIILSGQDIQEARPGLPDIPASVFEAGVPILALGQAMPAMALALGGKLLPSSATAAEEPRLTDVRARNHTRLLDGIEDYRKPDGQGMLKLWLTSEAGLRELPPGFVPMATTALEKIVGIADESRSYYGLQAHPEISQTPVGEALFQRFARDICGCSGDWTMRSYAEEAIARIREQVGDEEVILGLSGGVDSSVAAALLHKAIGQQLSCVFVDHGLLRLNEARQVMDAFAHYPDIRIIHVDASEQFMQHLAGVTDPEAKRKIIGREFVEVFQQEAAKLPNARWLAQGTIYPDVIESGKSQSGEGVAVKSHHNVGGLPETLKLKLLEPLRELFKDEVRALGRELDLPENMVNRHPFPGPGLGVRVLGEVKPAYLDMLRQADAIFIDELRQTEEPVREKSWYALTSQAFAVFLPVKSVGVSAQGRRYDYVIALRAVETTDFMTATWAELPYSMLTHISARIINEVEGISRVVYDISSKPPATIEWE